MPILMQALKKIPKKVLMAVVALAIVSAVIYSLLSSQLRDFPRQGSVLDWFRASHIYEQANTLRQQHKTDMAIETYSKAIRAYMQDPRFHLGLGLAYMDKDDYRNAIAAYEQATRLNPRFTLAW